MIHVEVPEITSCAEKQCSYNLDGHCHATAITVGDGTLANCDTFVVGPGHVRDTVRPAGVGACKVTTCKHNDDLECQAPQIQVGRHDCLTFTRK